MGDMLQDCHRRPPNVAHHVRPSGPSVILVDAGLADFSSTDGEVQVNKFSFFDIPCAGSDR